MELFVQRFLQMKNEIKGMDSEEDEQQDGKKKKHKKRRKSSIKRQVIENIKQ